MRRVIVPLFVLLALSVSAQTVDPCLPKKPANEDHLLFQYTKFLSESDALRLDSKLVSFARETSNRIAVVIVDSLCGYPPGDFAFDLGTAWGMGKKGIDNGVILLVKPTGPPGERQVFIATGYALEGAIPDLTSKRIVDEEIIPRFKEHDFFGGLDKGTDVLMALAKGEINAKSYGSRPFPWGRIMFIALIIFVVIAVKRGQVKSYARTNNMGFWAAWALLNAASNRNRGSWGGFSGGGGFGGGGGGGFGGFGGGSFGGGGAGGSW